MKKEDLIKLLESMEPDEEISFYTGHVEEFLDRGIFENTDDKSKIQVFIKHEDDL